MSLKSTRTLGDKVFTACYNYTNTIGARNVYEFLALFRFWRLYMAVYAITCESSGPFPAPGMNNEATMLTSIRIVTCPQNKPIAAGFFTRSDGQTVASRYNAITDEMCKGRPSFESAVPKLKGFISNPDNIFLCFGNGYYEQLLLRYGIKGKFVDLLPAARDLMARSANINNPSGSGGAKIPKIAELAEWLGFDNPVMPEDKAKLICETALWIKAEQNNTAMGRMS